MSGGVANHLVSGGCLEVWQITWCRVDVWRCGKSPGVGWMSGGVANLKAVLCLDVGGDAVGTVDWERAGVMGGYHGSFITVTVNLIGQFPVTHTHTHTHSF